MAIFNYTRQQLRHLTASLVNDLITGTVVSPGSGTFVCTQRDWEKPDDFFNDYIQVFCYYGTGVDTDGNPTDWLNSTHTLTFAPAATLTAGDLVEMHRTWTVSEMNDAVNHAIEMVAKEALVHKVDTSLELATDTYQYTLPTQFLFVQSVEIESATADRYDKESPIDPRYWRIVPASTIKLEFVSERWTPTNGRNLRVTGLASPSVLDTDGEECPINPAYISYQAAALLHQSRIRGTDVDSEMHATQMTLCQAMADKVRATLRVSTSGMKAVVET